LAVAEEDSRRQRVVGPPPRGPGRPTPGRGGWRAAFTWARSRHGRSRLPHRVPRHGPAGDWRGADARV